MNSEMIDAARCHQKSTHIGQNQRGTRPLRKLWGIGDLLNHAPLDLPKKLIEDQIESSKVSRVNYSLLEKIEDACHATANDARLVHQVLADVRHRNRLLIMETTLQFLLTLLEKQNSEVKIHFEDDFSSDHSTTSVAQGASGRE